MIRRVLMCLSILLVVAGMAAAAPAPPNSVLGINLGKGGDSMSIPMQIVILLTLLTLLPAVVMSINADLADINNKHRAGAGFVPLPG